jgi:hypothetical protein
MGKPKENFSSHKSPHTSYMDEIRIKLLHLEYFLSGTLPVLIGAFKW